MTKEQIEDRIKLLEQERDQAKANIVAYEGAIQDCNFWLSQIPVETPEVQETND